MTNNEIFKKLLFLTQLNKDQESLEYIFLLGSRKNGTRQRVSPSKVRGWRDTTSARMVPMPDSAIEDFFAGLFEIRDLVDKNGLTLFDCRYIIDDIKELNDE